MNNVIIFLADYLIWVVVALAVALVALEIWKTKDWRKLGFIVLAGFTALLLSMVFHLLPVESYLRPYQIMQVQPLIEPNADTPFPSDHVLLAFAAAFAVFFMTRYKKLGTLILVLAFLVLFGRLLAFVHSPLDVIGGIVCAAVGAAIWYYIYHRENLKHMPRDLKALVKRAGQDLPKGARKLVGKVKNRVKK
ncbi:MAG: phosphatase PAP2 family protein [Candidatus Nomurabacteria bacterium]|nr:phosphatase PAP2 family protein [Candidatus Nomurabacteria bacterium]